MVRAALEAQACLALSVIATERIFVTGKCATAIEEGIATTGCKLTEIECHPVKSGTVTVKTTVIESRWIETGRDYPGPPLAVLGLGV